MGRGKGKGSAFERDMCRELSIWWNKHDDTFYKTQGSGNRATVRAKAGKRTRGHYGDVAAVDSRGSLLTKVCVVSLKRGYKGSTCQDLLDQSWSYGEPIFATWIREVIRDQQSAGVAGWMIIQRRDRKDSIVFMNDVLFRFLREGQGVGASCPSRVLRRGRLHAKAGMELRENGSVISQAESESLLIPLRLSGVLRG